MAEEFTVFERQILQESDRKGLFVRLFSDRDTRLQYVQVKSITLGESLGVLTPMMIVDLVDGSGDFFNHNRLDTEAVYTLIFGRDAENSREVPFKIADIQYQNGTMGQSDNVHFRIIFAHRSWQGLSARKRMRGWKDVLYSDVVKEIMTEAGYTPTVEASQRLQDSVLQSNSTDTRLISDIASWATPASSDGHYEYAARLDGRFFFESTGAMINKAVPLYQANRMPLLRLGGDSFNDQVRAALNEGNVPLTFLGFSGEEEYVTRTSNGASAIESGYYDWEKRKYVKKVSRFEEQTISQLSAWSLLRSDAQFVSKKVFGGRDPDIERTSENRLSSLALNMQTLHINIDGQHTIHSGDIIEILVPTAIQGSISPFNEMYSGFYMVKDIKHQLHLHKAVDYVTQISLVRHGMDINRLGGYLKSAKGKAAFNG